MMERAVIPWERSDSEDWVHLLGRTDDDEWDDDDQDLDEDFEDDDDDDDEDFEDYEDDEDDEEDDFEEDQDD